MRMGPEPLVVGLILATTVVGKPLDTARWLVDLGRDYPRTQQAGLSDADGEITLLLMQAAGKVDPGLAEPHLWQYDMLSALRRDDAARQALGRYVELQPDDIAAHLDWLAQEIERLQTAEQRAQFCAERLRRPDLPGKVASDLRRRLAEFFFNRGQRDRAIEQAKFAIDAYDFNFTARELLEAMESSPSTLPAEEAGSVAPTVGRTLRLSDLLLGLTACPDDPERARAAAEQLLLVNLPEPADRLYAHATALLRMSDPLGDLAPVMTDRVAALRALGREAQADELIKQADEQWCRLLADAQGAFGPQLSAEMAWFYTGYQPQPDQAERLARVALAERPDSIVARRALGSALRQLGHLDEAKAELAPIADKDVVAAAEYAQALAAGGAQDLARQTLNRATTRPADPNGRMFLARSMRGLGVAPPASRPALTDDAQAVSRFPWPVLDYPFRPDKYMSLTLQVPQREMPPGEPWLLTARLRNVGSFPVTLGPGLMVVPDLLMSVATSGDRARTTGPTIRFSFNRTTRLMPGETVEVAHTVDLGAIRSGMIGTPQMTHEVTIAAVLSPLRFVNAEGQEIWAPDIGGLLAELKFIRSAFAVRDDTMAALFRQLRSADPFERIAAMELLTMLLAEQQHILAGRLQYAARPIDAAAVQAAILAQADDADWQVRLRLAECLRWIALDADATNTASRLLSDSHWLVRGLAMRALADHYGAKFQPVLTKASQADPDDWVRRLTAALTARIAAAASQPALTQEQGKH
ncbi:MAG: HEAT repeat domain-containing protein [Planctomycetes bacterium]|nr:HEAT repeat domain-containing protein [Planctomycetota bacterium]